MEDLKSMTNDQWDIVRDLQLALKKTAPQAGEKSTQAAELSRALESAINTWRMLKDLNP